MSDEIKELRAICHQTQTDVEVLKVSHKALFERIEEIRKQLDDAKGNYKMWHLAVITGVYAVLSLLPHDRLFDLFFK